jgi:hypothetical protein
VSGLGSGWSGPALPVPLPPPLHPVQRQRPRTTSLIWIGSGASLAVVLLIAFTAGFGAAAVAFGAALLAYAALLLVMGRAAQFVPRDIRTARSNGATRMFGLAAVCASAYVLIGAFAFSGNGLPPMDILWSLLIIAMGCVFAAQFLAWRAVRRDPTHPEHGKRPFFVGGTVPVTRLATAAASLGLVSLVVASLAMGAFISLSIITVPLGALGVVLGVAALVRALVRRRASRAVPVLAIVAGLASLGITDALASSNSAIEGIACVHPNACLGVGRNVDTGFFVPVSNARRGSVVTVTGTQSLDSIACPSPTDCIAVGSGTSSTGVVVAFHRAASGAWTAARVQHVSVTLSGIACTSEADCTAVGEGVVVVSSGTAGVVQRVPAGIGFDAVACPAPGSCEAVGATSGNTAAVAAPITGGEIGSVTRLSGSAGLFAIACPTTTTCWAVGEGAGYGVVTEISDGRMGAPKVLTAVEEASSISCATADLCVAAGYATGGFGPSQALVALSQGQVGASSVLGGGSVQPQLACFAHGCLVTGTPQDDGLTVAPLP